MNTNNIKLFLKTVELGSMSKSAEIFCYTPSALSHMIRKLEEELSVSLLKRRSSGVELTKEGKALIPYMKKLLQAEDNLTDCSKKISMGDNTIKIGTYASISKNMLPAIISEFKKENPNVKINIIVANDFTGWITENKCDIVFSDISKEENCKTLDLGEEEYYIVAKKGVIKKKELKKEDIYKYTFIMPNSNAVGEYFDTSKFKELIPFLSDDDSALICMAEEGLGVTMLPKLSVNSFKYNVDLIKITPTLKRKISVIYKSDNKSQILRKFINHLRMRTVI